MNSEQFTYWLQGYAEICGTEPTAEQWQVIKDHLQLVFQKVTPARNPIDSFRVPYTPQWPSPDYIKPTVTCAAIPKNTGAVTIC